MRRLRQNTRQAASGGYLIVLFVLIVAFVGVVSAMQTLVLTSVATTSRALDTFRQGSAELVRLERAVAESILDHRQISVFSPAGSLEQALGSRLGALFDGGLVAPTRVPALPTISTFPNPAGAPDALDAAPSATALFTPELALLSGPRVAAYPEMVFEFSAERTVLDVRRTYRSQVTAQLVAVSLTRFPISAYELPGDIAGVSASLTSGPESGLPAGLVPARDPAFITALQSRQGVLPYHYRRRAALAAAYQYVFSQQFMDRVAEYAGITHYHNLDTPAASATLAGMTTAGSQTTWDLGIAGAGTYQTITQSRDAAVVFTCIAGKTLRLRDSAGNTAATPMLLLLLGPPNQAAGTLDVVLESIARPVVIIGANLRIANTPGASLNGALFLDPASGLSAGSPLTVGHLSYWAGSAMVPANMVAIGSLPSAAEVIAPRVVYVSTRAARL